jgi:hypothetical protein
MNFLEAVEQMKQGKKVKRKLFTDNYLYIKDEHIYHTNGEECRTLIKFIEATDWEVVEEPKKTLWDKRTKNSPKFFEEYYVREALKEYIDWLKQNDMVMDYKRKAKEIFGEELLK